MKNFKHRCMAFFLLFVTVLPFAEKLFHDAHHEVIHCSEKNLTHFHAAEHSCNICDQQITESSFHDAEIQLSEVFYSFISYSRSEVQSVCDLDFIALSARAPPSV